MLTFHTWLATSLLCCWCTEERIKSRKRGVLLYLKFLFIQKTTSRKIVNNTIRQVYTRWKTSTLLMPCLLTSAFMGDSCQLFRICYCWLTLGCNCHIMRLGPNLCELKYSHIQDCWFDDKNRSIFPSVHELLRQRKPEDKCRLQFKSSGIKAPLSGFD